MYIPPHFEEPRLEIMHELIRARPLATLVTLSPGGLEANHIPLHLSTEPRPFGTLRGHVARANPMWREPVEEVEALAVFHGPDAYISPSWYATKKDTGKVVPTWNYAVVHAYGTLRFIDDAAWIRAQLETLTDHNEAAVSERWRIADAPEDFTARLIAGVVGIEIVVTRLLGKWKVSQNQPAENRLSVSAELRAGGVRDGAQMAALVEEYSREQP